MINNVVLIAEVVLGLLGLLGVSAVRRNLGGTAAAVTGTASALALVHGIYQLSRRFGETRTAQALSLFTASATLLFCINYLFPPAAAFFGHHKGLLWTTPLLASIGWATNWRWIQIGFWVLLVALWIRELSSEAPKLDDLSYFILGRQVYVVNNCSRPWTVGLALNNRLNSPTETFSVSIGARTGKYLEISGQLVRTYYDAVYHSGTRISAGTSSRIGTLDWRFEKDSDGDLQLSFTC